MEDVNGLSRDSGTLPGTLPCRQPYAKRFGTPRSELRESSAKA